MTDNHRRRQRRPYNSSKYNDEERGDGDGNVQQHTTRSQNYRRRQAAISLNSFSSKKGHDRALQEYKRRKETKFQKNAALLREYQRAMKAEGYDAGRGASRKRDRNYKTEENAAEREEGAEEGKRNKGRRRNNGVDDDDNDEEEDVEEEQQQSRRKRHKSDPLHHARKQAELRKAERAQTDAQKEQRQREEMQKSQGRKDRARKLMKRTRRGQPVMKNVVNDLLGRIKSDVGEG
mmetsp:Transcript_9483/g.16515  ORF Transcript_9483/g.16515 Transcript_9483/m.16515 type:complete len:234 (+) Transcript_9483:103-804(+)